MEASAEATWRRAVAIARRTYSRSRSVMPSAVTYVRYTGKAAMTSRSARVRAPSVKSREARCFSEIVFRRCASVLSSAAIEVSMMSRLQSCTISVKPGR